MKPNVFLGIILITAVLIVGALGIKGAGASDGYNQNLNVAFRDGTYIGKLAAERGERLHIPWGRWAETSDRKSFVAGYKQAYGRRFVDRAQRTESTSAALQNSTDAAFRDGLYLGKLDAGEDRPAHVLVGRWSRNEDRASFKQGYTQAYEIISLARNKQSHGNRSEAFLLR